MHELQDTEISRTIYRELTNDKQVSNYGYILYI